MTTDPKSTQAANPFDSAEQVLSARANHDLPMMGLADSTSDILGKVLSAFELPYLDGREPLNKCSRA